jgi:signal transduction histidine kinase
MWRLAWIALWPAGAAFGALSAVFVHRNPGYAIAGDSTGRIAVELLAGYALIACGLLCMRRPALRRFATLLTAAGFGWFLLEWNNPGIGSAFVFTVGLTLSVVAAPLVAHALLAYPGGRAWSGIERVAVGLAYAGAILALGVLPALVFDPAAQACSACPRNLLLLHASGRAYDALSRIGIAFGLVWALLLIGLFGWRTAHSTPAMRRLIAPVDAAAGVYFGFLAALFAHGLGRGYLSNDPVDRQLWLGQAAASVALALGVAAGWLRARRTRSTVARLVVELSNSPAGTLEEALARNLGDAGLRLAYPLADGRYVDAGGQELALSEVTTPLVRDGLEVARLAHRPGLLDDQGLIDEVTRAARLVLENERLQAEARAQLEDLRASRARVIANGDAERRRLERDLHDGAQQHLVGLVLRLGLTRARLDPERDANALARVKGAETELRAALGELRDLARGIFPAVLAEEGFASAIVALAEDGPISLRIASLPDGRVDPAVEAAAYFVVSEALRQSVGSLLTVNAECSDGVFALNLRCERPPADIVDLEDRVGALDGSLTVVFDASGLVTLRAEIPCAS